MSIITLPVSLGEALDKLTILDIKMNKIKDQRLENVKKEYNMLYENLKEYVEKYSFHYENLKKINLIIWEMQDDFRYNKGNKIELCLKIIDDNDARFRIKNKINILSNSLLKEQKGYKPKQCVFLGHFGLGDHINMIGAVRYLSLYYDEVYIVCFLKNKKNLESFYKDDSSIKIISTSIKLISCFQFFKKLSELPLIVDLLKNKDIFSYGFAKLDKNNIYIGKENTWNKKNLPIAYYNNISCPNNNITFNSSIFWDYFHISENIKSKTLYNELLKNKKYIFIHNTSTRKAAGYNVNCILNKFSIDMYSVIIINPEINVYNKEDEFYEIAQKFVYLPIIDYVDTIINAEYIILSDSCFFCLSLHLPIKTKKCYVVSKLNWSHIHNDKNKSSNINYVKKFININLKSLLL